MYTIKRTRVTVKHPYIKGRTSSHTEYELWKDGEKIHDSRSGRIFKHVAKYKKYVSDRFDIDINDIEVSDQISTYRKQGWK